MVWPPDPRTTVVLKGKGLPLETYSLKDGHVPCRGLPCMHDCTIKRRCWTEPKTTSPTSALRRDLCTCKWNCHHNTRLASYSDCLFFILFPCVLSENWLRGSWTPCLDFFLVVETRSDIHLNWCLLNLAQIDGQRQRLIWTGIHDRTR